MYPFLVPENAEEKQKRIQIEKALKNESTTLNEWQRLAISEYGLISGKIN